MLKARTIYPTKEGILSQVTQKSLMEHYLGREVSSDPVTNPFRKDNHPGCTFGYSPNGTLYFRDWALGRSWDGVDVIRLRYGLSYSEALYKAAEDIYLGLGGELPAKEKALPTPEKRLVQILTKPWDKYSLEYWHAYGIDRTVLDRFNVLNVRAFYVDKLLTGRATKDNPIFGYWLPSNNIKIYRPLHPNREKKWYGNTCVNDIFGYNALPEQGKLLIITKSLKDVMVLYTLGFNAVAPQSETTKIPVNVLTELKNRFDYVILFYDNDLPGMQASGKYSKEYCIPHMFIPMKYGVKDISDFVERFKRRKSGKLIKKLIKESLRIRGLEQIPF